MGRNTTKPAKWLCAQRRLRSAWASTQSDQSLCCPHEESLGSYLPIKRTAKTLIRLGGCPVWSESSLSAQPHCWFCHVAAQIQAQHECRDWRYTLRIRSVPIASFFRLFHSNWCESLPCFLTLHNLATSQENQSLGACEQVRLKAACAATEAR